MYNIYIYIMCIYIRIYNIMLTPMGLDCTSSTWSISLRLLSFVLLLITCLFLIIIRKSNMKIQMLPLKASFCAQMISNPLLAAVLLLWISLPQVHF